MVMNFTSNFELVNSFSRCVKRSIQVRRKSTFSQAGGHFVMRELLRDGEKFLETSLPTSYFSPFNHCLKVIAARNSQTNRLWPSRTFTQKQFGVVYIDRFDTALILLEHLLNQTLEYQYIHGCFFFITLLHFKIINSYGNSRFFI